MLIFTRAFIEDYTWFHSSDDSSPFSDEELSKISNLIQLYSENCKNYFIYKSFFGVIELTSELDEYNRAIMRLTLMDEKEWKNYIQDSFPDLIKKTNFISMLVTNKYKFTSKLTSVLYSSLKKQLISSYYKMKKSMTEEQFITCTLLNILDLNENWIFIKKNKIEIKEFKIIYNKGR